MAKFTLMLLTLLLITFSFATISKADQDKDDETITAVGFSEILPENDETKTNEVSEIPPDRPMKIIRFHPINRHFPRSQLGSLRVPIHRCRHRHHGGIALKPMRPRQMSFGNQHMTILPSGENGDFDPMVHVVRQVPERWIRIHRHHDGMPRFPMGKHHDFFADKRFPIGKHQHFLADRRFGKREERQDRGFMRNIRKFLNGQF